MKAFRFTLEAVQTLRHRQEQQAMEQYVRALLSRHQAMDHLEAIRDQITRNQKELSRLLSSGCPAFQAAQVNLYQRSLEKTQAERVATLAQAERRVNAAFQTMLLARQQHKTIDTYREKQKARYEQEVVREEQKMLDDLAGRRARSIFSWNPGEAGI